MSIKRYQVEYYGLPPTRTHVAFTEHENGPWCHYDDVVGLEAAQEDLEEIHQRILSWCQAYPIDIFPEPTLEQFQLARKVLSENGMTLDEISASNMRHVVSGIQRLIDEQDP